MVDGVVAEHFLHRPSVGSVAENAKEENEKGRAYAGRMRVCPYEGPIPVRGTFSPSHAPGITIQQFNDSTSVHHHLFGHRSGANHVHALRHRDRQFADRSRDGADDPAAHVYVGGRCWERQVEPGTSTPSHGQRHREPHIPSIQSTASPYDSPKIIVEKSCGLVWGRGNVVPRR